MRRQAWRCKHATQYTLKYSSISVAAITVRKTKPFSCVSLATLEIYLYEWTRHPCSAVIVRPRSREYWPEKRAAEGVHTLVLLCLSMENRGILEDERILRCFVHLTASLVREWAVSRVGDDEIMMIVIDMENCLGWSLFKMGKLEGGNMI